MNSNPKNDNQETKQNQTIAGVVLMVVFMLGFGLFVYAKKHAAKDVQIDEKEFAGIFDRKFNNSTDEALIEKQNQKLASMNQNIEKLSQEQEKKLLNERERAGLDKSHIESTISQMKERIEALEKENKSAKNKLSQMASKKSTIVRPPSRKEQIQKAQYKRQFNEQRMYQRAPMRHVRFVRKPKVKKKRTSDNYVWAGTQVEGVLVTGILGDAGINGSKNKGNGVIRLIGNGDMPSKKKSHLKDCTIIYSSYGDLSGNSAVVRLVTLSCASNKMNFEKRVYGSVYDSDAMQDLRGTPILNTSPLLKYSTAAGILAGIGKGLENAGNVQALNANGTISSFSSTSLVQQAAGGGLSYPSEKISEYIMKIADIYHPLVVIKPGRKVTIVFNKGFWTDDSVEKQTSESRQKKGYSQARHYPNQNMPKATPTSRSSEQASLDELLKNNPSLNKPLFKGI